MTHIFSSAEADDANAHVYDHSRNDHTQYALASATPPYGSACSNLALTTASGTGVLTVGVATPGLFLVSCYLRATGPCTVTAYPSSTDESGAGAGSFFSGPLDAAGAPNIMNAFAFSGAHRISCYPMALRATSGFLSVIAWASVANSCYISAVINQLSTV